MRLIARAVLTAVCVAACAGFAGAQTDDEIVEKGLAAGGGRAALEKIKNRSTKGKMTVSTQGGEFPATIETLNEAPNKARTLLLLDLSAVGAGTLTVDQRFDGTTGYVMDSMRGNGPMPDGQVAYLRTNIFPTPFLNYKERGTKIVLAGKEKIGDREAYVLSVTPATGPVARISVDTQTYLPLRLVSTGEIPEFGNVEQTLTFADFRDVDGIKVPFRLEGSSSVQTFTIIVSSVEHNVKIDPALFVKPADK